VPGIVRRFRQEDLSDNYFHFAVQKLSLGTSKAKTIFSRYKNPFENVLHS
jgi:hypothetical protein